MLSSLNKARSNREAGFTLIELLVVIVIIGILAAIAIPVFSSQRARAQDADAVSEARSVLTAIETLAAGTTGVVTGDASSAAGQKALGTAIMGEGATSTLPKTAAPANAYAGDIVATLGDSTLTQVVFSGTGYVVETVTTNGSKTKVAVTPTTANATTAVTSLGVTNNARIDRSTAGSSAVTAGTVVLGW